MRTTRTPRTALKAEVSTKLVEALDKEAARRKVTRASLIRDLLGASLGVPSDFRPWTPSASRTRHDYPSYHR